MLVGVIPQLVRRAEQCLPDRLASLPIPAERPVLAMDGTYQHESAHFYKSTPSQGGQDNRKGHALLSIYNVRLGCPCDVHEDTRSRHEVALLRDYDDKPEALTRLKNGLWLVDRAFIDAPFWENKHKKLGITMITRMKANLVIDDRQTLPVADLACNKGVVSDEQIQLNSASNTWRLICYRTPRGHLVEFLTNEHELEPGVVAFLYSRRWEEEKCFDTWKNDFAQNKAWGKNRTSIRNQALLAVITSILVALLVYDKAGRHGIDDEKSLRKQQLRQQEKLGGTDRPTWTTEIFRRTTKICRQVLRFLKAYLYKKSTPGAYRDHLWPLLLRYL